jgi:hypothetical protein
LDFQVLQGFLGQDDAQGVSDAADFGFDGHVITYVILGWFCQAGSGKG